ncbi:MAG: YdeI/OmpD-associated family protein [Bacteroidaceae bacterium]|nr:YdeI/OmpD-associated family protein [Bacteroidaceae bacterium]
MDLENILDIKDRTSFWQWLKEHHAESRECWIEVKRGRTAPENALWYLDAVEEALCFGWIDSTLKHVGGRTLQRFGPRRRGGKWSELNKERCRRLESLGLMTDSGRAACPDLQQPFVIPSEILDRFMANDMAWRNFRKFPSLYQRVRIDTVFTKKPCPELFDARLKKLIEASERGEMIGEWNDYGRLLDY